MKWSLTTTQMAGFAFVAVVAFVGIAVFFYSQSTPAAQKQQAKVQWQPDKVVQFIAPGGEKTIRAKYESQKNLSGNIAEFTPSLAPYTEVIPAIFPSEETPIEITFRIPSSEPYGILEGTLYIRDGKKAIAKPLPITIHVNEDGLPPDPGEVGKTTLEGIDLDNDGVRDDVQRWIGLTYSESAEQRAATTQYVKTLQIRLIANQDRDTVRENALMQSRALFCLEVTLVDDLGDLLEDAYLQIFSELFSRMLNTKERSLVYINGEQHLGGLDMYHSEQNDYCDADISLLKEDDG